MGHGDMGTGGPGPLRQASYPNSSAPMSKVTNQVHFLVKMNYFTLVCLSL